MLLKSTKYIVCAVVLLMVLTACLKDKADKIDIPPNLEYDYGTYDDEAFEIQYPSYVTKPLENEDNPLTKKGVLLGRKLFYDPVLSADSNLSCNSCHHQDKGFSSNTKQFRNEYKGILLERNAMTLTNMAWHAGFGWDNRKDLLEDKVEGSVENPYGINGNWDIISSKLMKDSLYPRHFYEAFETYEINEEYIVRALSQFIRTIVSYNSKFDRFMQDIENLSDQELLGMNIFSTERGDCFHCHTPESGLFLSFTAFNNGIDSTLSFEGFEDLGYGNVSNSQFDNGKFKAVSLRNIGFTAPYMHDGRFATLREVLEHYNSGGHFSPTVSPTLKYVGTGLNLSEDELDQLEAFLNTLNDSNLVNDTTFSNPF